MQYGLLELQMFIKIQQMERVLGSLIQWLPDRMWIDAPYSSSWRIKFWLSVALNLNLSYYSKGKRQKGKRSTDSL